MLTIEPKLPSRQYVYFQHMQFASYMMVGESLNSVTIYSTRKERLTHKLRETSHIVHIPCQTEKIFVMD